MKLLLTMVCALVLTGWVRADGDFTKTLTPEERAATGLDKLSPEELVRLKAVVERYKSGEVAVVQQQAEQKVAATEARVKAVEQQVVVTEAKAKAAEQKAAVAEEKAKAAETKAASNDDEAKKKGPGWLHALITLEKVAKDAKGAEPIESRLVGDFHGWRTHEIFVLENGQRWQWVEGSDYVTPPMPSPKVKVYPGAFGSFWMEFEGVRSRVRVKPLKLE